MTQQDNGGAAFDVETMFDKDGWLAKIQCTEYEVEETARQASEGMGFSEFALRQFGDMVLALLAARSAP